MKFFVLIIFLVLGLSCGPVRNAPYTKISGSTMGTTYNVTFQGKEDLDVKREVDQLLIEINKGVSTYEPESVISIFNNNYQEYLQRELAVIDTYFIDNYRLSMHVYDHSHGAFDPTIMSLVNYWGFGYTGRNKVTTVDTSAIESLIQNVGLSKLESEGSKVIKENEAIQLDFSAIAKGYGVDRVSDLLSDMGCPNHYIEIGGEVFAKGINPQGSKWKTGITVPQSNGGKQQVKEIIEISDRGIATSGNYINYYESNGEIYSHTINPKTGFPERSKLLSATVIANSCALADGFATACMVIGVDKSIELINLQKGIEGILIFADENDEFQVYDSRKK